MTKKRINKLNPTYIPSIRGGIYFCVRNGIIKYIGMSNFDVYSRVLQQKKSYDLHDCEFKILYVKDYKKIRWYERRWIQKYKPSWNKLIPSKKTNYLYNPYQ